MPGSPDGMQLDIGLLNFRRLASRGSAQRANCRGWGARKELWDSDSRFQALGGCEGESVSTLVVHRGQKTPIRYAAEKIVERPLGSLGLIGNIP